MRRLQIVAAHQLRQQSFPTHGSSLSAQGASDEIAAGRNELQSIHSYNQASAQFQTIREPAHRCSNAASKCARWERLLRMCASRRATSAHPSDAGAATDRTFHPRLDESELLRNALSY